MGKLKYLTKDAPKRVLDTVRTLKCTLTGEQQRSTGLSLAQLHTELEALRLQKKDVLAKFKDDEDRIEGAIASAAKTLHQGFEHRLVSCRETHNFQDGTVTVVRLDTGEEIEKREMTAEERQLGLELGTPSAEHGGDGCTSSASTQG